MTNTEIWEKIKNLIEPFYLRGLLDRCHLVSLTDNIAVVGVVHGSNKTVLSQLLETKDNLELAFTQACQQKIQVILSKDDFIEVSVRISVREVDGQIRYRWFDSSVSGTLDENQLTIDNQFVNSAIESLIGKICFGMGIRVD